MTRGGSREGTGRPATGRVAVTTSISWRDPELLERFRAYAEDHGLTVSETVVRAARQMLEREGVGDEPT